MRITVEFDEADDDDLFPIMQTPVGHVITPELVAQYRDWPDHDRGAP